MLMACPGPGRPPSPTPHQIPPARVTVAARHALIGEAIGAALRGAGFRPAVVPWHQLRGRSARGLTRPVLLLCDLDGPGDADEAVEAVRSLGPSCVVLTSSSPDPWWGAVLEAGVGSVLSSDVPVERVAQELRDVARGRRWDDDLRQDLVVAWHAHQDLVEERRRRLDRLTRRERVVLELLHQGKQVAAIADLLMVAEATVRAHVRRILVKLEVESQLGAVALLAGHRHDEAEARSH